MRHRIIGGNTAVCIIFISGISACGKSDPYANIARVTGRVTCNGQPATGGIIVFTPADEPATTGRNKGEPGRLSSARVAEDGSFSLMVEQLGNDAARSGALVGNHSVTFQVPQHQKKRQLDSRVYRRAKPEEIAKLKAQIEGGERTYEPLKCGDAIQPATVTVVKGKNEFVFELSPALEEAEPVDTEHVGKLRPPIEPTPE